MCLAPCSIVLVVLRTRSCRTLRDGSFEGRFSRHFVPEGHTIVARRFIAGLAINKIRVPEGRLKLVLRCYESGVPDRFELKISPRAPNSGVPAGRKPYGHGPRR